MSAYYNKNVNKLVRKPLPPYLIYELPKLEFYTILLAGYSEKNRSYTE